MELQYGCRSNQELLLFSGFLTNVDEFDRIRLALPFTEHSTWKSGNRLELSETFMKEIENDPQGQLQLLALTLTKKEELLSLEEKTFAAMPENHRRKTLSWLLLKCKVAHKTLLQDKTEDTDDHRIQLIQMLKEKEKVLLQKLIGFLEVRA